MRAAHDALDFESRIKEIQTKWTDLVHPRKGSAASDLIDLLPGMPALNIDQAVSAIGKAARRFALRWKRSMKKAL